jgi:hypothetical protein
MTTLAEKDTLKVIVNLYAGYDEQETYFGAYICYPDGDEYMDIVCGSMFLNEVNAEDISLQVAAEIIQHGRIVADKLGLPFEITKAAQDLIEELEADHMELD